MQVVQLTLDQYAAFVKAEATYRLSDEEKRLVNLGYTRMKRKQEKEPEIKVAENKAREYRRVRTFERYLSELERKRTKKPIAPRSLISRVKVKETDDLLTAAMKQRHRDISNRASVKGIPFDLTVDFLIKLALATPSCPMLDIPLVYFGEGSNAHVDRHIPELGYTQSNCVFMSAQANGLKVHHTLETAERLVSYLRGELNS